MINKKKLNKEVKNEYLQPENGNSLCITKEGS